MTKFSNSWQEAEKSLLYFRNIRKYSKHAKQQINEDIQKLNFNSDEDDNKLSLNDFSEKTRAEFFNLILFLLT